MRAAAFGERIAERKKPPLPSRERAGVRGNVLVAMPVLTSPTPPTPSRQGRGA